MGKDYIIVETVGVGQDEVEIVKSAHTTVIVVIPGMGDDIQAIKAGILEAGDIFVINKSEREGSGKTFNDLRTMIKMDQKKDEEDDWMPPVLETEAIADKGVKELLTEIEKHRRYLVGSSGDMNLRRRKDRARVELAEMIKSRLLQEVFASITEEGEFENAVESILQGETDPYTASEELILKKLGL
jgi:LAO/AO transport system kinase